MLKVVTLDTKHKNRNPFLRHKKPPTNPSVDPSKGPIIGSAPGRVTGSAPGRVTGSAPSKDGGLVPKVEDTQEQYQGPNFYATLLSTLIGGEIGYLIPGIGYKRGQELGAEYWSWYDKAFWDAEQRYKKYASDRYNRWYGKG